MDNHALLSFCRHQQAKVEVTIVVTIISIKESLRLDTSKMTPSSETRFMPACQ